VKPVKHPQTSPKPKTSPQPKRTNRSTSRAPTSQKKGTPTKADEQDFKRWLMGEPDPHADPVSDTQFHFLQVSEEPEPEPESAPVNALIPDLTEGIEENEQLPAEFSMVLPETGEVRAQLTSLPNGGTNVALGFHPEVLMKMIGFEKEGERLLSRRLGKPVRLHFKRIEAV